MIEILKHRKDVFYVDSDVFFRADPYPTMEPLFGSYDFIASENDVSRADFTLHEYNMLTSTVNRCTIISIQVSSPVLELDASLPFSLALHGTRLLLDSKLSCSRSRMARGACNEHARKWARPSLPK